MRQKLTVINTVLIIAILVTACSTQQPSLSQTQTSPVQVPSITPTPPSTQVLPPTPTLFPTQVLSPTPTADTAVLKAWFYKPPKDGNLSLIANEFNFFILSKGNESQRDQLLALGAKKPILQYIRFEAIMDPGSCTQTPWQNNAAFMAGDFCTISAQHPDWFLLDQNKQRIVNTYSGKNFVMMDPGNPGWRAFFLERVRQTQDADKNWNGVFLDNVEVTRAFREKDKKLPAAYPDDASYQAAVQGFLQYLYTNYFHTTGHLLYANLVARRSDTDWTKYITYLDGAMHEGWAIDSPNGYRPATTWEEQMTLAEQTQAMGKFIVLVSHGKQNDLELQKFAFASYLLINQGQAAFRYASSQSYNVAWLYDDYNLALGQPLGPRLRDGNAWRRNFTHGSVLVNPQTHEVQININS